MRNGVERWKNCARCQLLNVECELNAQIRCSKIIIFFHKLFFLSSTTKNSWMTQFKHRKNKTIRLFWLYCVCFQAIVGFLSNSCSKKSIYESYLTLTGHCEIQWTIAKRIDDKIAQFLLKKEKIFIAIMMTRQSTAIS